MSSKLAGDERFDSSPSPRSVRKRQRQAPALFQRRMGREESLSFLPRTTLRSARINLPQMCIACFEP
ncbi:hypothetical protein PP635_gp90 [Arthrobacter phage Auxilium]|uniref:Uncharacterized protein n=1 Tax=Arthrobacter phage Auxilium TaxID=2419948 RepID=A0A3G2KA58_9CAUD|nr:hypothetical protein PP635_gp90 [Arthrobacter phage Auxilium]AYN55872.1 hypothetical protein PBI_AUXILIUM_90 [Arthrobacter phage Auxilium]